MHNNKYPKILILGMTFDTKSGGGVTLRNLFNNWPNDKLFIASEKITEKDKEHVDDAFKLKINAHYTYNKNKPKMLNLIIRCLKKDINKIELLKGKIDYYSNIDSFLEWVNIIKPDVIYFMTHKIYHVKLIQIINKKTLSPVAIHIVDDWLYSTHGKFFNKFIAKKLDIEFKKILSSKNLFFGISNDMKIEYKNRYNVTFIPVHNPIIKKETISQKKFDENNIKILYAGTIEKYNIEELIELSKSIENKNSIVFNIYGKFRNIKYKSRFNKFSNTYIQGTVNHDKIIELMNSHDILFLPMSFKKKMAKITRLSMPTKFTEYINSGTVTLLFAPIDQAVTNYARSNTCAYIVSEKSQLNLKNALRTIINSKQDREFIIKNAFQIAQRKHSLENVQKQFINSLLKAIK